MLVSSGSAMGPRACIFWVEMPISAPNPNTSPSVTRTSACTLPQEGVQVLGAAELLQLVEVAVGQVAVLETTADAGFEGGIELTSVMTYDYPDGKHQLGRFRISATTSTDMALGSALAQSVVPSMGSTARSRMGM